MRKKLTRVEIQILKGLKKLEGVDEELMALLNTINKQKIAI